MPNRVIRDWTDSLTIDKLSCEAERFFTRLMMKADDYGCYHANTRLLQINLFPWKKDLQEESVKDWLEECVSVGLITVYVVDQKECLVVHKFNQTLRAKNRKFPPPPTDEVKAPAHAKRVSSRKKASVSKEHVAVNNDASTGKLFGTEYDELILWMQEYAPAVLNMPQPLKEDQFEKLRQKYTIEQIHELLAAMGNSAKLSKYSSAYGTFTTWAKHQKWTTDINHNYDNTNQQREAGSTSLQEKIERAFARGHGAR